MKNRSQKTSHAPPRAGETNDFPASSTSRHRVLDAPFISPPPREKSSAPYLPSDKIWYFLMDKNAQGVFRCFLSPISKQLQLWLPCHLSSPRSQNKINCGCHATPCPLLYQDNLSSVFCDNPFVLSGVFRDTIRLFCLVSSVTIRLFRLVFSVQSSSVFCDNPFVLSGVLVTIRLFCLVFSVTIVCPLSYSELFCVLLFVVNSSEDRLLLSCVAVRCLTLSSSVFFYSL
uniref:Transmembrane protein n=1 Tax=Fagus sylvatica TaxID=28930 RepID=A0A2N9INX8_FAGSY